MATSSCSSTSPAGETSRQPKGTPASYLHVDASREGRGCSLPGNSQTPPEAASCWNSFRAVSCPDFAEYGIVPGPMLADVVLEGGVQCVDDIGQVSHGGCPLRLPVWGYSS